MMIIAECVAVCTSNGRAKSGVGNGPEREANRLKTKPNDKRPRVRIGAGLQPVGCPYPLEKNRGRVG